jgi:hypothetical protein
MDELADSIAPARYPRGLLRHRLAGDGCLFFRGLLPAAQAHTATRQVTAQVRRPGRVDDRGTPSAGRPSLGPLDALGDPAFRSTPASPALTRIPDLAGLGQLTRQILGRGRSRIL